MDPLNSAQPRATLGRVLEDLGTTLLTLAVGAPTGAERVGGVAIHDPYDRPELPVGAIVLGVGLRDEQDVCSLLSELGEQKASALVLRAPIRDAQAIRDAAEAARVALFGLTRGASWTQLVVMLRSLLAEDSVGQGDTGVIGGVESGDLFALANAITSLLDAPVTIEDRSSRILAFSGRQGEADPSRVEAILGRQAPAEVTRLYLERGIFRELYRSERPVWIDPDALGLDQMPRVAIAVRAGDEVLGSIWATVEEPLTEERAQALVHGAKLVALHLLQVRAGADVERRLRSDLVSTALEGGAEAREALARLGLADQRVILLALEMLQVTSDGGTLAGNASIESERRQLSDAFAVHLTAFDPRSATALVGNIIYGLVPTTREGADAETRGADIAREFLERVPRFKAIVGVGPVAGSPSALAHSRTTAGRALRVLRARAGQGGRVATLTSVHFEALLVELQDIAVARGDEFSGPLAQLFAYDAEHDSALVQSLRTWFDAFGDVALASNRLAVHPNTLRYRLKRISEVCGIDLADPDTRLALMLQIRMTSDRRTGPIRQAPHTGAALAADWDRPYSRAAAV